MFSVTHRRVKHCDRLARLLFFAGLLNCRQKRRKLDLLIQTIPIQWMPVRRELARTLPVPQGVGGDAEKGCGFFDG